MLKLSRATMCAEIICEILLLESAQKFLLLISRHVLPANLERRPSFTFFVLFLRLHDFECSPENFVNDVPNDLPGGLALKSSRDIR